MQAGSGSIDTRGLRALRQRQFDTQPSSDSESEHSEVGESSDSESDGEDLSEKNSDEDVSVDQDSDTKGRDGDDDEELDKKRKRVVIPRVFSLYKSWDLSQHEAVDVHAAIRVELAEINAAAGLMNIKTVQHQDRNNIYGDWIYKTHWVTGRGSVSNKVFLCPLARLGKCQCQAKITETSREIKLFITNMHTSADHGRAKDESKFLKAEQRRFIAEAVRIAPLQTATELMRNVQDSPTKSIDPRLKRSVERLVMKERRKIDSIVLEGVVITDQIGPLHSFTEKIWIGDARKAHHEGVESGNPACIPLHKVFCIGRAFNADECYTMLSFATPWTLLNFFRSIGSGYPVMLQGDVTGKASSLALNKLGLGFNRLGGHFSTWTSTLIPAEQESQETYTNAYIAAKQSTRSMIRLPSCDRDDCHTCSTIRQIRANELVKCCLASYPYTKLKELAISVQLGDQTHTWKNTCLAIFKTNSRVCQTHASSINGLNGRFRSHFLSQSTYEEGEGVDR